MSKTRPISRTLVWGRIAAKAVYFMLGVCGGTFAATIPRLKADLHLTTGSIGLGLFFCSIGGFASMQLAAPLIRRFGLRSMLMVLGPLFPLVLLGIGLAPNFITLAIAFTLFGAITSIVGISINAQAIDIEKAYARSIMSSFHALYSIGGLVGAGIGGVFAAKHLPTSWSVGLVAVALSIVGLVVMKRQFDASRSSAGEDHEVIETPHRHHRFKWWRQVLTIGGLVAICFISEGVIGDWSALYMQRTYAAGPFVAVLAYILFNSCMATGRLAGDGVIRKLGPLPTLVYGSLLAIVGMLTGLMAPFVAVSLIGFGVVGIGLSVLVPILISMAGSLSGGDRNQAIARVSACGSIGGMIGPASIGFIADHHGLFAGMLVPVYLLAILAASAMALHGLARRKYRTSDALTN